MASNAKGQDSDLQQLIDEENQVAREEAKGQIAQMLGFTSPEVDDEDNYDESEESVDESEDVVDELEEEEDVEEEDEDEESGEEESEDDAVDESKDLTYEAFQDKMEELFERLGKQESKDQGDEESEPAPAVRVVDEETFEQIISSPETFNQYIGELTQAIRSQVLQDIPEVISQTISRQTQLTNAVSSFYQENPDLKEHQGYVSYNYQKVAEMHPDWTVTKQIQEAGKRARVGLGLAKTAQNTEAKRRKNKAGKEKPAFAPKTKSRKGGKVVDNRSDTQKQIQSMLESIR